jgi:excisionase family DNA binding protein
MPTLEEQSSNLVSIRQAAEILQFSVPHVYDLVRHSRIPSVRIGKKIRLRKDVLSGILDRGLPKAVPVIAEEEK